MSDRKDDSTPSVASPLFTWLAVQLLALGLAASRVKLWAHFPMAGETVAMDELLVVQFLASSLLFPFLCRDARSTIAIMCASFPMIALAGYLSFGSIESCGMSALNLSLWLTGLGLWRKVANRPQRELIAIAIVSSLNIGGTVLAYLGAETNGTISCGFQAIPLLAAVRLSHFPTLLGLLPGSIWVLLATCAWFSNRASLSTPVMH